MDKYEYKIRAEEIKELIAEGSYAQAAEIADTIDWRRVRSVMMLCTISDLYKINRRYEDARDMLLLAYERRPGGRLICYSLCELSLKTEEYVQAMEYFKEFVQVAPKDPGRYILQYKIYEAQDVSLEERIEVLEELKKKDYREKWAYELAYLYHRVGLATRCVEECDELILWFGDGKYVIKAMELKMLHQPLTAEQQEKYDGRFQPQKPQGSVVEDADVYADESQASYGDGQYADVQDGYAVQDGGVGGDTVVYEPQVQSEEEMDIQVKTMDVGEYNTINLQAELAEGLREILEQEQGKRGLDNPTTRAIVAPMMESDTESLDSLAVEEVDEEDLEPEAEQIEDSEVFFGDQEEPEEIPTEPEEEQEEIFYQDEQEAASEEEVVYETAPDPDMTEIAVEEPVSEEAGEAELVDETADTVMAELRKETVLPEQQVIHAQPPKEIAGVLSQESDGQIRLVMPESENLEKQITGQMSIEDILLEWERMKRENQEKREEEVRQHVLQHTGNMFTEFEAMVRDGLLEKLEKEQGLVKEEPEEEPAEEPAEEAISTEDALAAVEVEAEEEAAAEENDEVEELAEIEEVAEAEEVEIDETEAEAETAAEPAEEDVAIEEDDEVEELAEIEEVVEAEEAEAETDTDETEAEAETELIEEANTVEEGDTTEEVFEEPEEAYIEDSSDEEPDEKAKEEPDDDDDDELAEIEELTPVEREKAVVRSLTKEEKELFGPYIQSRAAREQLAKAIDTISMAAYTGNVVITGDEGMDTVGLAKNIVRDIQNTDSNFSGKVAKISGHNLNKKDIGEMLEQLKNGALIIEKASGMNEETAKKLYQELQKENFGIVVILEDVRKQMKNFLQANAELQNAFNAVIDVEAMSNDALVAFGRKYAREMEYSIDDLGILALHTRIENMQTSDHVVTVTEVREIIDEAIHHADRKTIGHFFDILFAKRYDDEDMIILTEKDFA